MCYRYTSRNRRLGVSSEVPLPRSEVPARIERGFGLHKQAKRHGIIFLLAPRETSDVVHIVIIPAQTSTGTPSQGASAAEALSSERDPVPAYPGVAYTPNIRTKQAPTTPLIVCRPHWEAPRRSSRTASLFFAPHHIASLQLFRALRASSAGHQSAISRSSSTISPVSFVECAIGKGIIAFCHCRVL